MMPAPFTAADVLRYLDHCISKPYCFFMDLQHGYFYTANSRLTLYADERRWAIVFEKSGYGNRTGRIELELNFFGNGLHDLDRAGADGQFLCNAKWIPLVDNDALAEIRSGFEQVSPAAKAVKLRGAAVPLPSKDGFARWVPDIFDEKDGFARPTFEDLGRFLAFEYADLCRAQDAEKRLCLPADLPQIMTVDAWHHRAYYDYMGDGDAPSTYETFPMLAQVLVTRDPSRFRPTLPPTSHWSNWPDAGQL
jgi:hypothetical protein